MSAETGLSVFVGFPEIELLGQAAIQQLCDSWLSTVIAKEFAVSSLEVTDNLSLLPQFQFTHTIENREAYQFPVDRLLFFIADNGVADAAERETLKARITAARRAGGRTFIADSRFSLVQSGRCFLPVHCAAT